MSDMEAHGGASTTETRGRLGAKVLNEIIGSGIERGRWSDKMMFDVDWQTAK
jgi:hypothetical protein